MTNHSFLLLVLGMGPSVGLCLVLWRYGVVSSVSLLSRFAVRLGLVSLVVGESCVMAWNSLLAGILGVVCSLQPVSDMTMRSAAQRSEKLRTVS